MNLIQIVVEAVGLVVGGLVMAALISWLSWSLFKLVRHPEFGVPLILLAMLPLLGSVFGQGKFCRMVFAFMLPGAVAAWFAGVAWRKRRALRKASGLIEADPTGARWT